MPEFLLSTPERVYIVSPDDEVPASGRLRVWIEGRVIDEVTSGPPRVPVQITVRQPGFFVRVTQDNFFAVAGVARRQFLHLDAGPRNLDLELRAPGYLPMALTATIPQTLGYPNQVPAAVDLGLVALHREPVMIAGRVVQNKPGSPPVSGATLRLTGLQLVPSALGGWSTPNLAAVRPPLYFPRTTTGANPGHAGILTLTSVMNEDKRLRGAVAADSLRLPLDNRVGLNLNGGDLMKIDLEDGATEEIIATAQVSDFGLPTDPAQALLAFGLKGDHRAGALVRRATVSVPTADKALARDAIRGDAVLFVADLNGWQGATALAVQGGAAIEYHVFSPFVATTDAEGFYRLPPISRVAAVQIEVKSGAQTSTAECSLDYTQAFNFVNFRL